MATLKIISYPAYDLDNEIDLEQEHDLDDELDLDADGYEAIEYFLGEKDTDLWNEYGEYISQEYDIGTITEVGKNYISYDLNTQNCDVTVLVRYSLDGNTWTDWQEVSDGDSIFSEGEDLTGAKIQYKLEIETDDREDEDNRPTVEGELYFYAADKKDEEIDGNLETQPDITVNFESSASFIELYIDGDKAVRFETDFSSGDTLEIYAEDKQAKLNSSNARKYLEEGKFRDLLFDPGEEHSIEADSDGTVTLKVNYKPRWL